MELACALVLLIVGFVTAGPYGYGTKGGAAAKADALAVSGAYVGAGSIPLSIPSGTGYSGSFSQSSSSSSSSSSASSSSFTYSGAGAIGGATSGGNGCSTGKCNAGDASGSQGSANAGSQAYSGANAGSLAGGYGGKLQTGSYGHKYSNGDAQAIKGQDCGSEGCQGTSDLHSSSGVGTAIESQSSSDAKAAASAGVGQTGGSNCGGFNCNNVLGSDNKCVSGQCGFKAKCSSGSCGEVSDIGGTPSHKDDSNLCTSGQCGPNQSTDGSSSNDSETNDINVNTSGSANSKLSYGANKPGCSNGDCGSSPAPGSLKAYGNNKPALDLTAPKLEPSCTGFHCQISPSGYSSSSQTKVPYDSTSYQYDDQLGHVSSSGYVSLPKPTYAHGSSPYSPKPSGASSASRPDCVSGNCGAYTSGYGSSSLGIKPSYSHGSPVCNPGSPGCAPSTSPTGPSGCTSGNCGGFPTSTGYSDSSNKPSYPHGSSSSFSSLNPSGPACTPGSPGCPTSTSPTGPLGCTSGNCGGFPTSTGYSDSSNKPSFSHGSSPSFSSLNPSGPACTPGSPDCPTSTSTTGPSDCTSGNCGGSPTSTGYSDSSNKPSYSHGSSSSFSSLNPSGPACTPGSPGCPTSTSPSGPSGCISGNCGGSPTSTGYGDSSNKPSYSHGSSSSFSSLNPAGPACIPGSPGCPASTSPSGPSSCASGNCGGSPISPGYSDFSNKPSYSHGGSPSYIISKPLGTGCAPGTPGCGSTPSAIGTSGCTSEECSVNPAAVGYDSSSINKPSYSHGNSPSYTQGEPAGLPCAPGTLGCNVAPPASRPSDCISGNCGAYPSVPGYGGSSSIKPNYSQGGLPAFSTLIPSGSACIPGSPGCSISTAASGSSGCASGICDTRPSSAAGGSLGIKPSYSYGSLTTHTQIKPAGPACAPGTPGCALPLAPSGEPGCALGAPGCAVPQSLSSPSGCASGKCGAYPLPHGCAPGTPGCSGSPSSIHSEASGFPSGPVSGVPSYGTSSVLSGHTNNGISATGYGASSIGSSSFQAAYGIHGTGSLQTNPSSSAPGIGSSPQLATAGTGSQDDAKENIPAYTGGFGGPDGILKPNEYSTASASSLGNKPIISTGPTPYPSIPFASSSASGIGSSPQLGIVGATAGAASGQEGAKENLPVYTGGFGGPDGVLKPNEYSTASASNLGNKPIVSTSSTTYPSKPVASSSASDIGSLPHIGIVGATAGASGEDGAKENLPGYIGGFGGPDGILKPNEYSTASASSLDNKPKVSSGHTYPSIPFASISASGVGSSTQLGIVGATAGAIDQVGAKENLPAYTGGFGGPDGVLKPNDYGTASAASLGNKPIVSTGPTTYPSISFASSSASGIGSSPQIGIAGATAGASGHDGAKENLPAYIGGFGGPGGILKPNEYNTAPDAKLDSLGNKPIVSTGPTNVKPSCFSGICGAQTSPSQAHSGTAAGAHTEVGASATANALAYTGGFGGPPGLLKPYDDGKADIKGAAGLASSFDLHQGVHGSGYVTAGSQIGGSAVAHANAAAASSAGASSGDKKFQSGYIGGSSHGHGHDGGCGGGCGSSGSLGYSGSLSLSKTGVLDESSNGLAAAGAVAKSIANASSGARAFGSSYSISSATAHAGAAVKGGYGRR